jgi:hypothetical protein
MGRINNSVCTATGYGLDNRMVGIRFPAGAANFSLRQRVHTGYGAHPASYPMGTKGSSLGVKRPGREPDHSLPPSAEVKECVKLYPHSTNTSSWRGALLSTGITLSLLIQHRYLKRCLRINTLPVNNFHQMHMQSKI